MEVEATPAPRLPTKEIVYSGFLPQPCGKLARISSADGTEPGRNASYLRFQKARYGSKLCLPSSNSACASHGFGSVVYGMSANNSCWRLRLRT